MLKIQSLLFLVVFMLVQFGCKQENKNPRMVMMRIARSHIDGNVPDKNDFDRIMRHDLKNYFGNKFNRKIDVEWELLRHGPTQTGIAYPKFYLWVKVLYQKKLFSEGAVRVAAVNKVRFDITHYVEISEIRKTKINIKRIFPRPVCERIRVKISRQ